MKPVTTKQPAVVDQNTYVELNYAVKEDEAQIIALPWEHSNCTKDLCHHLVTLALWS